MPMNPRLLVPRATFDPDAATYLRAVEAADGQALETPVKRAVDDFIRGMKAGGIWDAIKASCILCGARTLAGALVPLVGTAPTNNNFVAADYNRKTGLVGNGSTKYLNSNRNNNADPQDSQHAAVYVSTVASIDAAAYLGTRASGSFDNNTTIGFVTSGTQYYFRSRCNPVTLSGNGAAGGLAGVSRSGGAAYSTRSNGTTSTVTQASGSPVNVSVHIFSNPSTNYSDGRLAFYSIGESLDLALLDARVSALVTAIGAAI